jgi:glycosyltransferase involved in cell wall biosynthesis
MPKVDVIMPAYNAARYLPAAIESVMAQTFTDWRILVIDDGSTDRTVEVVEPYLKQLGQKIQYIKRPNGGVSAARNTGIRSSTAEYLAMLDADDIWLPCRLSESLSCLEGRPQAGLSYGFLSRINQEGTLIDTFDRRNENAEGFIAPYIYMRKIDLPTVTVTVRRSCLDEVGLFDETLRVTEDRDLWFRVASKYEVALVPVIVALYRTSSESITADPNRMLKAQLQFIDKHYGDPGCGFLARQIARARCYKQRAEVLAGQGRPREALFSSMRALAYNPLNISNQRTAGSLLLNWVGKRS